MSSEENFNLVSFFDQLKDPVLVLTKEGIDFINQYLGVNFIKIPTHWKEVIRETQSHKLLESYFKNGSLPKSEIFSELEHVNGGKLKYQWNFIAFPNEKEKLICIGKITRFVPFLETLFKENISRDLPIKRLRDLHLVDSILQHSHDMLAIVGKDGDFKFISSAIIEKLGVRPSEVIGKTYHHFIKKGIITIENGDLEKVFKSKRKIKIGFWINLPNQERILIESHCKNLLNDPLVEGILFSAHDNTEYYRAKKSLQKRYELENLINRISAKFVNADFDEIDNIFRISLKMLGEFEKADRAYIFLVHQGLHEIENVYEWSGEGIESQILHLKNIPFKEDDLTIESLTRGDILVVPDVDLMPEKFAKEREVYQQQGIKSFVLIPIFSENRLIGFFGLDAVREKRAWHEKDEYVLRQLGDIYAGSFINRAIKRSLDRNKKLLASTEILAKSGSWRYSNSKKRIFFSNGLKRIFEIQDEVESATFTQFITKISKKDRIDFLQNFQEAIEGLSSSTGTFSIIANENKEKYINYSIQVRKSTESDEVEVFGYCTDITHKRDAENYLKLQSQILAQVNDPIYVTDDAFNIIYINKAGLKECEINENDKFEGKITDLFEFLIPGGNRIEESLKSLGPEESFREQMELRSRSGEVELHEVSVQYFLNDDQDKIGYSFVIRNLTLQVRQEAMARKAQMIVENSPAVLFTVDPNENFRILYISDNIRQFGFNATKLIESKTSILELVHPDDVKRLLNFHSSKKSEDGIPAFSGEYRIQKLDGSVRWVEDRTREVYDSEGKILTHEGIIQDITERKKDREEILKSQERYRVLASNIPGTSIFLIDRDLRYIVAQGTNFADWGMTSEDFEGKTLTEVHTKNLNEIQPIVTRALLKNEIVQKHIVFRKRVYEITVRPIIYGGEVEYALGILRDINDEHQAKEDLKKNEEKYRRLVEESTEIIFSLAPDMAMTYISPNVKQFLGYPSDKVIGKKLTEFLHEDDLAAFAEKSLSEPDFFQKTQYHEFKLRSLDGSYKIFSSNGKLVSDEEGNLIYYTGIARDITKLKEAQKELFLAKEKAEQASNIKSQFLSIMSHEIRTPMNAVIGMAHLLIEDNPRHDQLENLRTLQFSAENLLGLINDILDYSKIDSGKVELEKVSFELNNVFNRILHSYSYQAREKSLEILFESDPSLPKNLIGDPVRLGQIVNNLVSNAVKFTEQGSVKIRLTNENEDDDYISIRFDFEDTGIGIPQEKLNLVFEAFTQASAATTRKYGGTGLGLAIVKRLVELFGSKIQAYNRPEGGTRFTFTINFEKPKSSDILSPKSHADGYKTLQNTSILVAEDNLVNQIMIKKFLNKWGVGKVVIANDGNEAISAFEKQDFNLILLDLQMPDKDGFQVAEFVRSFPDPKKKKIPIIALTASSLIEVKEQLEKVGMDDYIPKPFNPDNLYAKILKILEP
ncbi:PAS domain S-box protein [Aquiflexum sp.]|uniref:PAS domain S-box protein n=1 Tax=Aquiflexum sp. TaxID=1872584 RepID=UPI0035944599